MSKQKKLEDAETKADPSIKPEGEEKITETQTEASIRDDTGLAEAAIKADSIQAESAPTSLEDQIADLEIKLAEANDQFLRKAADFENFRKRMIREKQEAIDYANQSLLLDLIETIDDFERALISAEATIAKGETSEQTFKAFYEGIVMIEKRLCSQLESKWGLKRYISAKQAFDPNFHEAVMMEKSPDITEPVVDEEYSKGYTLKERVVRHAKVKVLMPAAKEQTDGE